METLYFPSLGFGLEMNPVAFSIGGIHVYWYGIFIATAFLLALIYAFKRAKTFGLNRDRMVDVIIGGVIGGVIGARLYYVVYNWSYYMAHPEEIIRTWEGGLAIYGGVIGAMLAAWLVCKWRKVRFLPMADVAVTGFFLGQCIGRWGNFVNIEAFGSNTDLPWGMTSQSIVDYLTKQQAALSNLGVTVDPTAPVHPCFLYESLWCLAGFIFLALYTKRRKFDGELFLMYVAWYGAGRFWIEGLRTDSLLLGSIRISQLVALVSCIAAVILIIVIRRKIKKSDDPNYLALYVTTEESQHYDEFLAKEAEKAKQKKAKRKSDIARAEALYAKKQAEKKLQRQKSEEQKVSGDPLSEEAAEEAEEAVEEAVEASVEETVEETVEESNESAAEADTSEEA